MTISVKGAVRSRARINLWLFSIEGPWRSTPFQWSAALDPAKIQSFAVPGIPIQLQVSLSGNALTLDAAGFAASVRLVSVRIPVLSAPLPFQWEPIKGMVLQGAATVG